MGTNHPKSVSGRSKPSTNAGKSVLQKGMRVASPQLCAQQLSTVSPLTRKSYWGIVWAIALIAGLASGMVGISWLSVQLIVNPQSVKWVNRFVPRWITDRVIEQPAKSLQEIRSELHQQGKLPGDFISLGKSLSFWDGKTPAADWLLPVRQVEANCMFNCDRIVELRVYQTATDQRRSLITKDAYYLVRQLAITGLEESFAIAPLVEASSENQGSSRALPLTQIDRYEGTVPKQGVWLNLSGTHKRGNDAIAYGQILYYHPAHYHLSVKLQWTSPSEDEPVWKEVSGGGTPELIVNQTIGMEPSFEIYQVKPHNFVHSPVQLEPISVTEPVLEDSHYRSALLLARSRLWSTSLKWLQSFQQRSPQQWSAATQAQLDLIRWHALATQNQAEGSWSSPGQQILANLIDGRWERALTVFESSAEASQETLGVLKTDKGRLENRIKASLRVSPDKLAVKSWGTLLIAAQQGRSAAIAWLKKQPHTTTKDIASIQILIQRLDPNFSLLPSAQQHLQPHLTGDIQR